MTETISIAFSSLYPEIERHLSAIGKRLYAKDGKNMFSAVTVSSAERTIFDLYMQEAAQNVTAAIKDFVSAYTETAGSVTFKVTNTRWNDPNTPSFVESFSHHFKKYLVLCTVAEYLSMNFADLAKKYFEQADVKLNAIVTLVYFKAPPVSSEVPVETTVTQTLEFSPRAGLSTISYEIPITAITDVYTQWGELKLLSTKTGYASVTLYREDETTAVMQNVALPHTFTSAEVLSIGIVQESTVVVRPTPGFTADDKLILEYTTKHQ